MAQAQIVKAWRERGKAHLAVRIREQGSQVDTEYIGSVDLSELQGKTAAQQKELLVAAVKAERERSLDLLRGNATDLPGLTGTVEL